MTITVTLGNLQNLQNENTAVNIINSNNQLIESGFVEALSSTGDQMDGTLDMNSNQIINLPAPATSHSPVRLIDVSGTTPSISTSILTGNNIFTGTNTFTGKTTFTGSVYISSGEPWVDVKAFGAVGDGSNDDTTAIQNAINKAAGLAGGGGYVFFPSGVYKITSTLTMKGGVILKGVGMNSSFIEIHTDTTAITFDSTAKYGGFQDVAVLGAFTATGAMATTDLIINSHPSVINASNFYAQGGRYTINTGGVDGRWYNCFITFGSLGTILTTGGNFYSGCKLDTAGFPTTITYCINKQPGTFVSEDFFTDCDLSGPFQYAFNCDAGTSANSVFTHFTNCDLAGGVSITSGLYTQFHGCVLGSTTFNATSTGSVVSIVGCISNAGSITTSVAGTKEYAANFNII